MVKGYESISTLTGGQRSLLKQLLGSLRGQSTNIQQSPLFQQGSNFLSGLLSGSPESTQAFEAPALRQFNEQIIPGLAERFSGLGAGAQSSSAFQQALGQAGADLSERLASLRGNLGLQAAGQGLGYAQQPFSNLLGFGGLGLGTQAQGYLQKQLPFWKQLLTGATPGAVQGLSMLPFLF